MRIFVVPIILLLGGCVSMGSKVIEQQALCEAGHQHFIVLVDCLQTTLREMTDSRDGDLLRLYLAEAGLLALKVKHGDLSAAAARYELMKSLAFLQGQSDQRNDLRVRRASRALQDAGDALQRAYPPPSRPLTCITSYGVRGQYAHTTCH